jgi:23S rRNA G2445 N2-methylase RlmL
MARLSNPRAADVVLDPLCGTGTLLLERALAGDYAALIGGDRDPSAVAAARANALAAGVPADFRQWDALALPLPDASVDAVLANPPFGKKVPIPGGDPFRFYARLMAEIRRVLRPGGRVVLLTSQGEAVRRALREVPAAFAVRRHVPVLIRGERATIFAADRHKASSQWRAARV